MKSFFKRLLHRFDLEFRNFSVEKSENARFFTMLSYHNVNTIFDIGANKGQFGVILRDFGYKGRIVSFEPLTQARKKLHQISQNDKLWEVAPQSAIGEVDGEIEIHIAGNSESSSVLNMLESHIKAAPDSKYVGNERVPLRKLDTIASDFIENDSIVFLKIDTQGYEEKVMNGAHELINNIVGLQLEISLVPLYEGHSLLDEMLQNLKEKGFELWGVSTVFSDPDTAQLLQIDATFFRPTLIEFKKSLLISGQKKSVKLIFTSVLVFFKSMVFYLFDSIINQETSIPKDSTKKNIIIIRQDGIGDFIIWLDTAKEYRKLYPTGEYRIILVGNELWCDLAKELSYWDEIIPINLKKFKTISKYRSNILRKIKNLKAELTIQPTFSREFYHGDSLARASGAFRKIGSAGDMSNRNKLKKWLASRWHTELIPASQGQMSELERNAEFFSSLSGMAHHAKFPKLYLPKIKLPQNYAKNKFYVIVPGASADMKKWPVMFFSTLAEKIYRNTDWNGLICGTKNEYHLGEQILKTCTAPLENIAGKTELVELSGFLSQSQLIITNDTGTAHISSAVGTSTVCILGGGHFGRFVPYPDLPGQTNKIKAVFHKMHCYGCNWECVYTFNDGEPAPCIANVSVDEVWQEVEKIIEAGKN